ncbi:uncharacterized protein LOC110659729 isoform X2 [Hevea brasiliensis]|uniref:uncharacterized protein LOC110659729 isoform X2 n=1 Tax=Hevea brasiliensis TaxID=3981 RepID=UPI0025F19984|nr:uncharacterized protein LOC110659729 isoform X2 [Hevea brasiliensis]
MKDSIFPSTNSNNKRTGGPQKKEDDPLLPISTSLRSRKKPKLITKSALIHLQFFNVPLISPTGKPLHAIRLEPGRPYTIGRSGTHSDCDFFFNDRRVSKQHCQILFDSVHRKIYILDGAVLLHVTRTSSVVTEFRRRLICYDQLEGEEKESVECSRIRVSLNGVFVNGIKVNRGTVRELCTGDEILLACGNEGLCSLGVQIGFVIQGVVFKEEVVMGSNEIQVERLGLFGRTTSMQHSQGSVSSGNRNKRVFAVHANEIMPQGYDLSGLKSGGIVGRAKFLSSQCRQILQSDDPISHIQQFAFSDSRMEITNDCKSKLNDHSGLVPGDNRKFSVGDELMVNSAALLFRQEEAQPCQDTQSYKDKGDTKHVSSGSDNLCQKGISQDHSEGDVDNNCKYSPLNSVGKENSPDFGDVQMNCLPPGKKFYLNRLHFMDSGSSSHQNVISLPELLHPIKNINRIFIATFTSDILWFLSYCEIPCHLPVTIACHNSERCWSASPGERISMPYPSFPNLVVVFPPFPEAIAFGNDRRRQGIGCHHPKLLVLQREDSIRVIITSANLVLNQWNNVTNTVWWQDFPVRSTPDLSTLFFRLSNGEINQDSRSDFAAQLAGFMASLLIDVPSQAHWIVELTKYNFEGAMGYLVASIPGIHSCRTSYAFQYALESIDEKFLGLVEESVVGLSHLFRTATDTNGALLKRLAAFLGRSCENAYGIEIVLRRNNNLPADVNAVSILVPNPDQFSEGDCVQLGFLPRYVAKWVSPLWDSGFFRFSGYVHPKEALAAALGGSNTRVQLILQGPRFPDMMRVMLPEHVIAVSSLIASIRRCTGLWRLQEVLDQYKWPELEQSDFFYGSSSIGSSVNTQFLAAFSAATGKKSVQFFDSEESDPEWGCWTGSQESKNPSIRIIFPTIERVKNACNGILPSRRILCFSEKTWQRLRTLDILHDAVPHPHHRVRHPIHAKVARRRFQSKTDASSFGWVYCGSHNFSAAAWGRPISNPPGLKLNEARKTNSSLGLRLHVCNYELGIIFVFPPSWKKGVVNKDHAKLDDIVLPFNVPAPKYGPTDRPATMWAMREALNENVEPQAEKIVESANLEEMTEVILDEEEEVVEATHYVVEEKEEEKAYAEMLWSQSC